MKVPVLIAFCFSVFLCGRAWTSETDLVWSTFLGGSDDDYGRGIAVDGFGNCYLIGESSSSDFPLTSGAFDTTHNGDQDVIVVKLDQTGRALKFSTFLGGNQPDYGFDIAVDSAGNAHLTGATSSTDFPTSSNAFDRTANGIADVFVAKLNPAGSALSFATFFGGSSTDEGRGIALDGSGRVYVTGKTVSYDFPTTVGVLDTTLNGAWDVFVAKLNPTGSDLEYATFLGGQQAELGCDIALDGSGAVHVTGWTRSGDFPTTAGAYDTTYNGGNFDVFVAKVNPTASALEYATFLGGNQPEYGRGIAVDGFGNAYVMGYTESANFPTTNGAFDRHHNGGDYDIFAVQVKPMASALGYATFLGGSGSDIGYDLALDGFGNVYITGYTFSADFPTTAGAFDTTHNGDKDVFIAQLNPAGNTMEYATFLGGAGSDTGHGLALDRAGNACVTGAIESADFPTTAEVFDESYNDRKDAFVAKLKIRATEAEKNSLRGLHQADR